MPQRLVSAVHPELTWVYNRSGVVNVVNFKNLLFLCTLFASMILHSWAWGVPNKAFRAFWHPTYLGERLAYCTSDGKHCGKAVANRYCRMLGYDYSNQNIIAHNVGLTHYLCTRLVCKGWTCDGFMAIGCAMGLSHSPPKPYHYRQKKFTRPRYNNFRIDWCYESGRGCGARAAHSFCSRMGFLQAKHFVKEPQVAATKTLGSQELCFGPACNSFATVLCSR